VYNHIYHNRKNSSYRYQNEELESVQIEEDLLNSRNQIQKPQEELNQ
jgi:hypothetical protein